MKLSQTSARILSRVASRSRRRESGQELLEFGLLLAVLVPLLLGTFVTGLSLVRSIQTNQMDRDLADMYIHGADFSTYPMQEVAQRLARGLNLRIGTSFTGNQNLNTGNGGDGLVTVTQIMWVGATTDGNCAAVGATNCTNHDKFVFTERVQFGNGTLSSQVPSSLGSPGAGATITSAGIVRNYVTDSNAALPGSAQTAMQNLWQVSGGAALLSPTDESRMWLRPTFSLSISAWASIPTAVYTQGTSFRSELMASQRRRLTQKGVSLLVGTASMALLIPSGGLAIDAALLYHTKARLQGAVDGAALAAARSLSLGATTAAQSDSAKQNAVNWFYANFPNTLWGTSNTQMDQGTVQVFDDPKNPNLRNVTVTANTTVSTIFMRWFNMNSTVVAALGNASRRDAVMMMVLDRSGSMGSACPDLRNAAKIFTGQFAEGRDRIGLVTFSDNITMQQVPTTDFQTILGYTNNYGTGSGLIDSIACKGGTNTASAISVAYNELYKVNLPGALNMIVFETDGKPNTVTLNMWDSASSAAGIRSGSNCLDRSGIKKGSGGFGTEAASPYWQGNASTPTFSMGSGSFIPDIPAGMIGGWGGTDTGNTFYRLFKVFNNTPTTFVSGMASSGSPSCFSGTAVTSVSQDVAWIPSADVFGNNMVTSYEPVATTGGHITSVTAAQLRNAAFNAADSAAFQARTNPNLAVSLFGIGFTSSVDHVLLQRMANDPNGDSSVPYPPCASAVNCVTYTTQPQGTYVYAADTAQLAPAFLKLSSQILRLSK